MLYTFQTIEIINFPAITFINKFLFKPLQFPKFSVSKLQILTKFTMSKNITLAKVYPRRSC